MRKFNITVDGRKYSVEVEEVGSDSSFVVPLTQPVEQSVPAAANKSEGSGNAVECPMPGMIIDFKVENGASVKKGQPIIILEAMKMENDIVAPSEGIITFNVTKGASVETGTILAIIA